MLDYETVDDDGVLTRVPLPHAYAARWAKSLQYRLLGASDQDAYYLGKRRVKSRPGNYYDAGIEAHPTDLKVSTNASTFTLYFQTEPLSGDVSCVVGMWGDPFPEDGLEQLMLDVRDLPYSSRAIEKLIEKSDWLDANPMYRGLPGVSGKHLSVDTLEAGGATSKPANWDWDS